MEYFFPVEIIEKIKKKSNRNETEAEIWKRNKHTLLHHGYSQTFIEEMTYEEFDECKQAMGLDIMFWLRVCGHGVQVNWDSYIIEQEWIEQVYYKQNGVYCPPTADEGFIDAVMYIS